MNLTVLTENRWLRLSNRIIIFFVILLKIIRYSYDCSLSRVENMKFIWKATLPLFCSNVIDTSEHVHFITLFSSFQWYIVLHRFLPIKKELMRFVQVCCFLICLLHLINTLSRSNLYMTFLVTDLSRIYNLLRVYHFWMCLFYTYSSRYFFQGILLWLLLVESS